MQFSCHNNSWSITNIRIFFTQPVNYATDSIVVIPTAYIRHSMMMRGKNSSLVVSRESSPRVHGSHVVSETIFGAYAASCTALPCAGMRIRVQWHGDDSSDVRGGKQCNERSSCDGVLGGDSWVGDVCVGVLIIIFMTVSSSLPVLCVQEIRTRGLSKARNWIGICHRTNLWYWKNPRRLLDDYALENFLDSDKS
jgi:hypothetical protein